MKKHNAENSRASRASITKKQKERERGLPKARKKRFLLRKKQQAEPNQKESRDEPKMVKVVIGTEMRQPEKVDKKVQNGDTKEGFDSEEFADVEKKTRTTFSQRMKSETREDEHVIATENLCNTAAMVGMENKKLPLQRKKEDAEDEQLTYDLRYIDKTLKEDLCCCCCCYCCRCCCCCCCYCPLL